MRDTRAGLLLVTVILLCFGTVMIYSASAVFAYEKMGDSAYYLKKHLLYLLLGLAAATLMLSIDYNKLRNYTKPILLFSAFLIMLVLVPGIGKQISGARRWFNVAGFSLQPSELVKFAMVLYFADVLSRKQPKIGSFIHGFLPPALALAVCSGLILLQPDLGSAILVGMVCFIMFFVSGIRLEYLFSVILGSLPIFYAMVFNVAYRRKRILAFLCPWSDPAGTGFQIIQSFIALGSGGLLGVGLGQSRQKLFYLPQSHTDFIFSIIGEELGLVGTLGVIALFMAFLWYGSKIALKAKDLFGQLLAIGILLMIGLQALINIGVATGTIPTKGLPLPFISYGGTSLVCDMAAVGLLLNIAKNRNIDHD